MFKGIPRLYANPSVNELGELMGRIGDCYEDHDEPIEDDDVKALADLLFDLDFGADLLMRVRTLAYHKAYVDKDTCMIPGIIDFNECTKSEVLRYLLEAERLNKYIKDTGVVGSVLESNIGQARQRLGKLMRESDEIKLVYDDNGTKVSFTREIKLRPTFIEKGEEFDFVRNIGQGDVIQPTIPWQTLDKIMEASLGDLPTANFDATRQHVDLKGIPLEHVEMRLDPKTGEDVEVHTPVYFSYHDGTKYVLAERIEGQGEGVDQEYRTICTLFETHVGKLTSRQY